MFQKEFNLFFFFRENFNSKIKKNYYCNKTKNENTNEQNLELMEEEDTWTTEEQFEYLIMNSEKPIIVDCFAS